MKRTVKTSILNLLSRCMAILMALAVQVDTMDSIVIENAVFVMDDSMTEQTIVVADDMLPSIMIDESICQTPSPHKSRIKNLYNHNTIQYIQNVYTHFSHSTLKEVINSPYFPQDLWVLYCVYII